MSPGGGGGGSSNVRGNDDSVEMVVVMVVVLVVRVEVMVVVVMAEWEWHEVMINKVMVEVLMMMVVGRVGTALEVVMVVLEVTMVVLLVVVETMIEKRRGDDFGDGDCGDGGGLCIMVEYDNTFFVIQDTFPLRNGTLLLKEDTLLLFQI